MTKSLSVRALSYTAVLTALSALANIFTIYLGVGNSMAVGFSYLPAFVAGAFINPLAGFLVGGLGDLIQCLIFPKGALNPIILFASAMLGFLPGAVFFTAKKFNKNTNSIWLVVISFVLTLLISTNLNTLGLYLFYFAKNGKSLFAVAMLRMPTQLINWGVNFALALILYKPISKLVRF